MTFTVKGFQPEQEVTWSVLETPLSVSGSTSTSVAVLDFIADVTTSTGVDNNCRLSISPSSVSGVYTIDNKTPSVCSFNAATGNATRLIDGTCTIEIASPGSKKQFTRAMLRSGAATIYTQSGFAAGSLTAHIASQIDAMINGKTSSATTTRMFAGGVRNPNLFTGALNLSASSNAEWPVHLLTSRHFVAATHVCPATGASVSWLDNSGNTVSATIVSKQSTNIGPDLTIGYLSAPIMGITPYSLLPATWRNYIPPLTSAGNYGQITSPILMALKDNATGEREVRIGTWFRIPASYSPTNISYDPNGYVLPSIYETWSSAIIGGDSGSAMVVPVNDGSLKTVLLCNAWQATVSAHLSECLTAINTAMNALATAAGDPAAGTYAVSTVELSGNFTSYA